MASKQTVGKAILEMKAAFPGVKFGKAETSRWAEWLTDAPDDAVLQAAEHFSRRGEWFPKFPDFLDCVRYIQDYPGVRTADDALTRRREELLQGEFNPEAWEAFAQDLEDAGREYAAEAMRRRIQGYLELEKEPA
jgi:hypothetical protein